MTRTQPQPLADYPDAFDVPGFGRVIRVDGYLWPFANAPEDCVSRGRYLNLPAPYSCEHDWVRSKKGDAKIWICDEYVKGGRYDRCTNCGAACLRNEAGIVMYDAQPEAQEKA